MSPEDKTAAAQKRPAISFAMEFSSGKTRKRFLAQMIPLKRLLEAHGVTAMFTPEDLPVGLVVHRNEEYVIVGLAEGERGYRDNDVIFRVCNLSRTECDSKCLSVNLWVPVIQLLFDWDMLDPDEITDDEIQRTHQETHIKCANPGCKNRQPNDGPKFKQCSLCSGHERGLRLPVLQGFYCSITCRRADWRAHKALCHASPRTPQSGLSE